jgi:hypothetical protein
MPYEPLKRNRYFDPPTEFDHTSRNHAEDMAEFHAPLARMHHANLHDWGIARGLEVSGTIGGTDVIIEPGVAIDINGQLIALATGGLGDIGANPPGGLHTEVSVPVRLGFGSYVGQALYVTIQFAEILRLAEGSGGRFEQVPWIRFQPVSGGGAYVDNGISIILAIVVIDAGGKLAELKVRDASLPYRRRLIGEAVEELRFRRSSKVGNRVEEATAAKIAPSEVGGLQIAVPNAGDSIVLGQEGGGNFSTFQVRANTVNFNGNLGIGTINPSRLLSLQSSDPVIQLRDSNDPVGNHWEIQANAFAPNNFGIVRYQGGAAQTLRSVVVNSNGNVGIGMTSPGFKLDVADRVRVRQGASGTAGIWFYQTTPAQDQAFVGMAGNNQVGFWGNTGANWGLVMDTSNGNVGIGTTDPKAKLEVNGNLRINEDFEFPNTDGEFARFTNQKYSNETFFKKKNVKLTLGSEGPFFFPNQPPVEYEFSVGHTSTRVIISPGEWTFYTNFVKRFSINQNGDAYFAGAKTGFVVDYFINRVGDTLEQGDVVVISQYQVSHYSGNQNDIPIPEVDLTQKAYDSRICGIVAKLVTEQDLPYVEVEQADQPQPEEFVQPEAENIQPYMHPLKHLAAEFREDIDPKKVQNQQMGTMVTLGAYAHCKVDADIASIQVGDLLTTSPTKGHAQKVLEPEKAIGAILGKALSSLDKGKGKIPVLVMLQ